MDSNLIFGDPMVDSYYNDPLAVRLTDSPPPFEQLNDEWDDDNCLGYGLFEEEDYSLTELAPLEPYEIDCFPSPPYSEDEMNAITVHNIQHDHDYAKPDPDAKLAAVKSYQQLEPVPMADALIIQNVGNYRKYAVAPSVPVAPIARGVFTPDDVMKTPLTMPRVNEKAVQSAINKNQRRSVVNLIDAVMNKPRPDDAQNHSSPFPQQRQIKSPILQAHAAAAAGRMQQVLTPAASAAAPTLQQPRKNQRPSPPLAPRLDGGNGLYGTSHSFNENIGRSFYGAPRDVVTTGTVAPMRNYDDALMRTRIPTIPADEIMRDERPGDHLGQSSSFLQQQSAASLMQQSPAAAHAATILQPLSAVPAAPVTRPAIYDSATPKRSLLVELLETPSRGIDGVVMGDHNESKPIEATESMVSSMKEDKPIEVTEVSIVVATMEDMKTGEEGSRKRRNAMKASSNSTPVGVKKTPKNLSSGAKSGRPRGRPRKIALIAASTGELLETPRRGTDGVVMGDQPIEAVTQKEEKIEEKVIEVVAEASIAEVNKEEKKTDDDKKSGGRSSKKRLEEKEMDVPSPSTPTQAKETRTPKILSSETKVPKTRGRSRKSAPVVVSMVELQETPSRGTDGVVTERRGGKSRKRGIEVKQIDVPSSSTPAQIKKMCTPKILSSETKVAKPRPRPCESAPVAPTDNFEELLQDKSRPERMLLYKSGDIFNEFPELTKSTNIILSDFAHSIGKTYKEVMEDNDKMWNGLGRLRNEIKPEDASEGEDMLTESDDPDVINLLVLVAYLNGSKTNSSLDRVERVYNKIHYATEEDAIKTLRQAHMNQPLVLKYGSDLKKHFLSIDGRAIPVEGGLRTAILSVVAATELFNLEFDRQVGDVCRFFSKAAGAHVLKTPVAVTRAIEIISA